MTTTDEAIERVERGANPGWIADATQALLHCAHRYQTFTSDDVWRLMSTQHSTREHRAMGAVFRNASRAGWIVTTGRFRPSERKVNHHRPIPVWRSQITKELFP